MAANTTLVSRKGETSAMGVWLSAYTAKLTEKGIAFEERDVPGKPLHQVFLHDPNGVKVEINFWDDG